MTSQTKQQIITIHISSNISRGKGNHTIKLGQLIEYNMWNNFLEKSYTKCGGDAIPRPFYKKIKIEHISRLTVRNVTKFEYAVCPKGVLP